MTARRVEVLVTDVDGTLTDQYGTVGVEALAALHKLVARGVTVVLASALPFFILKALSIYLGARGPIIAESGGVVEVNGKIIVLGDAELARRGLRALKERYGNLVKEKWSNRCRLTDIALERNLPLEEARRILEGLGLTLYDTKFAYHIVDSRVNKGRGLLVLCRELGVHPSRVAAVGDSEVDVSMLEVAGIGIAVANAGDDVKRVADYVTRNPYGKGFAEAVEWLETRGLI